MIIDVIHENDSSPGWAPITHLAQLAARLFGGDRLTFDSRPRSRLERLLSLRSRRRGARDRALLAILPLSIAVYHLRRSASFGDGYGQVGIWIIDSCWHEGIPPRRAFEGIDFAAVTRPNDAEIIGRATGAPTLVLPWGADVLDLGSDGRKRPVDVMRIGRQPPGWDDDAVSARASAAAGLRFSGRPPFSPDPAENHRNLMKAYATTKFVVAHSNRLESAANHHPREEYITGRWTDSLAAGAVVAGVQPRSDLAMEALWPEATLDFDRIDLSHNVAALREAVDGWTPELAALNHRQALARLDWRWRLAAIARQFGAAPPALGADLAAIESRLADHAPAQPRATLPA